MIKETHRLPIKSFVFKSSARPAGGTIDGVIFPRLHDAHAFLLLNHPLMSRDACN